MSCHVIGVISRKGGTGKTTTALCLAERLSARSRRTLLIDLDQQHNATRQYGASTDGVPTAYELLCDPEVDPHDVLQRTERGDIVPSDDMMNAIEVDMASLLNREAALADALDALRSEYDAVVIDCPPALGVLAANVLVASDWLVVPVECDRYSLEGFEGLLSMVERVRSNRRLNPGLEVAGLLVTMYESRQKVSQRALAELRASAAAAGTRVFDRTIRRSCKVREAQEAAEPLAAFAPSSTVFSDYDAWVDELLGIMEG